MEPLLKACCSAGENTLGKFVAKFPVGKLAQRLGCVLCPLSVVSTDTLSLSNGSLNIRRYFGALNCCSDYSHFCSSYTSFTAYVFTWWGLTLASSWKEQAWHLAPQPPAAGPEGPRSCTSYQLCSGLFFLMRTRGEWRNCSAGVKCCFPHSRARVSVLVCISTISQI